jgi:hypothetical protein
MLSPTVEEFNVQEVNQFQIETKQSDLVIIPLLSDPEPDPSLYPCGPTHRSSTAAVPFTPIVHVPKLHIKTLGDPIR